jgi:hypothetical protein
MGQGGGVPCVVKSSLLVTHNFVSQLLYLNYELYVHDIAISPTCSDVFQFYYQHENPKACRFLWDLLLSSLVVASEVLVAKSAAFVSRTKYMEQSPFGEANSRSDNQDIRWTVRGGQ